MTQTHSTSANVGFNDRSRRLVLETDSSPSLVEEVGVSYARVFPSNASPAVAAVMGRSVRTGSGVSEHVVDFVSFSNSDSATLRYPPSGPVSIQQKHFYKANPAAAYDAESNSIVLSAEASGICRVSYTSHYDRYKVTHDSIDTTNAFTGVVTRTFDPAFLVATAEDYEIATLELTAPAPVVNNTVNIDPRNGDYEKLGLVMETDAFFAPGMWPEYFSADKTSKGFTLLPQFAVIEGRTIRMFCGCKVRVYPRKSVTLVGVNCAVSAASVGSGERPCLEALNFSGSQSVNLQYPPKGSISLSATSAQALTKFGTETSVAFAGPGDWVNEVEWSGPSTYKTLAANRKVREDEVVAVTTIGRRTVPCYTFVEARYTSEYLLYDVLFTFDPELNWYGPAMLMAYDSDGSMVSMTLEPPSRSGIL